MILLEVESMKKQFLFLSLISLLFSCNSNVSISLPSEDTVIEKAIENFRNNTYVVDTSYKTEILRKEIEETYQPLSIRLTENYNYAFDFTSNRGVTINGNAVHEDMLYKDGEYQVTENGTRVTTLTEETYFKDSETGELVKESLGIDNTIERKIMADYNQNNATYTPLYFDDQFRNPFDYLSSSDFTLNSDGTYSLDGSKAVFVAKCFQRSSLTYVESVKVSLDSNNNFSKFTYLIEKVDASNYSQSSSYECVFSKLGEETVKHVTTYSNQNSELDSLFAKVKSANSYTYLKEFTLDEKGEGYKDDITAYYTQDVVFFHHDSANYPDSVYTGGNDYDYKVEKGEDDIYYAYEYNKANDSTPYAWAPCYVSGTTLLTYNTFKDIGPTFYNINTALFYKNDDGSYGIVDEVLSTIGIYFDNQFIGVHSDVLDGATSSFSLTINDDGGFTVALTYFSEQKYQNLKFTISDIDNTTLPFEIG